MQSQKVRLGDDCPSCGAGRMRVEQTRLLLSGTYRERRLLCRECGFRDTEVVPIDSAGRQVIARNNKTLLCPCCERKIEVIIDRTGQIETVSREANK